MFKYSRSVLRGKLTALIRDNPRSIRWYSLQMGLPEGGQVLKHFLEGISKTTTVSRLRIEKFVIQEELKKKQDITPSKPGAYPAKK